MQTEQPQLAQRVRAHQSYSIRPLAIGVSRAAMRGGFSMFHVIAVLVVITGGCFGAWYFLGGEEEIVPLKTVEVGRGVFVHEISDKGELQSAENLEIKCQVETGREGVTIIQLPFKEGDHVEKGDLIAVLDSSALENELSTQQIQANTSQAVYIQSQNLYETAKIALEEYQDGTFRQERELIESEIFVAEENLKRGQEYYEYSKKLNALGYVTEVQLQADKFAVDKARKELDTAKTKLSVLENYTKAKMVMTLKSEIRSAEAKMMADKESYDLELKKLKFLEEQISRCKIYSPAAGELVYANESDRRGNPENVIEELAAVRENQTLFWLPDKTQMQVRVKVNESRIGRIEPGMPAVVNVEARWGEVLRGRVVRVDTYPVPQHWSASSVREYYVYVALDNAPLDLRPGFSTQVKITVNRLDDAIQIPIQSVLNHGEKHYCAVKTPGGSYALREITVGASNDLKVVVTDGLQDGEMVVHNRADIVKHFKLPEIGNAIVDQRETLANTPTQPGSETNTENSAERLAADNRDRRSTGDSSSTTPSSSGDQVSQ